MQYRNYRARLNIKLMKRLWKELRRYEKFGDKNRLLKFFPKIGRVLSRQFSREQPEQYQGSFSLIKDFNSLISDLWYYSDRWCVWRYKRVKTFLQSELNVIK